VGDFGLVAVPDFAELTRSGRAMGAAHYMPYEMLVNPATTDPKPVDVYSLVKTLWVLATDQRFPPEGHQRAGLRGFGITDSRPHTNSHLLDDLVDRGTRMHPEDRPTMSEVAADLSGWLALPPETRMVDLGEIQTRFRERMQPRFAQEDLAEEQRELALKAVRRFADLVTPLNQALRDLYPRATIDGEPDAFTRNVIRTLDEVSGSAVIVFRHQRLSTIELGDPRMDYGLRFGRTIELTDDGVLVLHMYIDVGRQTLGGNTFSWMPQAWSAMVGSVEAEQLMRTAVAEAAEQLPLAASALAESLQGDGA
jgi:hypothetical protein